MLQSAQQRNIATMPADTLRRLWLCALWLPADVAAHVVALLTQAPTDDASTALRFAALCHGHASPAASLETVLGRLRLVPPAVSRARDIAAATLLVAVGDCSAAEVGGATPEATLARLRFEARVRRLREGFTCLWNVGPHLPFSFHHVFALSLVRLVVALALFTVSSSLPCLPCLYPMHSPLCSCFRLFHRGCS